MFRYAAILIVITSLFGCSGLTDEEIYRISSSSGDIDRLANTLTSLSKGRKQTYGSDKFSVIVSRKVVSAERFRPVLRITCEKNYAGKLLSQTDVIPLGNNVSEKKLAELAGRDGDIVAYLKGEIVQSLTGYIVEENAKVADLVSANNRDAERAREISNAVCVSYKDGLAVIHFSAVLLSKDGIDGSAPTWWAVNKDSAFTSAIKRELAKAQTSATRAMWDAKERVHHYEGAAERHVQAVAAAAASDDVGGGVALQWTLRMERLKDIERLFGLDIHLANDGTETVALPRTAFTQFRTAAAERYELGVEDYTVGGSCLWTENLMLSPGTQCDIRLVARIDGFRVPNQRLDFGTPAQPMSIRPVSLFEQRQRDASQ